MIEWTINASIRGLSMKEILVIALEKELGEDRDKKNLDKLWGKKK